MKHFGKRGVVVVMPKYKFAFFNYSDSAAEILRQAAQAQGEEMDLQLLDQGLEDAVPVAQTLEAQGVEVILSRRGTAGLLREKLQIPIISIPVTSIDILTAIQQAAEYGRKIIFPAFRKKIPGLEIVEDLIGIELLQGVYYDSKSLDGALVQASGLGCRVAVGGRVTRKLAARHGFKVVEIQTSEEEIYSTLENAKSVAQSNREERKKVKRFQKVLDSLSEGVVAVDQKGQIIIMNETARNRLQSPDESADAPAALAGSFPSDFQKVMRIKEPLLNRIESVKGVQHVVNYFPIMMDAELIGAVSTFKDIDNVVEAENALRRSWSKGLIARYHIDSLIHKSPTMQALVERVKRFAPTDSTILITGETGTGKEIVAQSIHNLSARSKKPFVSINCASLPDQLIESELFGYEQGAFTGARKGGKPGLFELAHTGSIFLDEISATPQNVQTSLLRVLEQREVRRVGGDRLIPVDLRIISAANTNLAEMLSGGKFRSDLFYRLNVLNITIPPLRKRRQDIPLLIEHFIQNFSAQHGIDPLHLPPAYLQNMMQYQWPGNVRQLANFIEQLVLLCGSRFKVDIFESLHLELISSSEAQKVASVATASLKEQSLAQIQEYESRMLWQALVKARFSKKEAARSLGMSRTTLWRKLKKANIEL
jgi:transcriptional regulator with PAS, ATPase and Fis domain